MLASMNLSKSQFVYYLMLMKHGYMVNNLLTINKSFDKDGIRTRETFLCLDLSQIPLTTWIPYLVLVQSRVNVMECLVPKVRIELT